ncbi:hypothetical protein AVEN_73268-1 [Araneus ventricosus]|uniref:Uncharacterized protein n=1 Tax=Araneus ventricosus TaxID=182803 RepID=A0A4Y2F255_ARAVE|nr:hypothetical protein AVEN_73268-1 [Araneus ventricosus]
MELDVAWCELYKNISIGSYVIRCTDLTPSDFFMWEYVEDCVYQMPCASLHELKRRIPAVIHFIAPQMLVNAWRETEYHFHILGATKGSHIDIY